MKVYLKHEKLGFVKGHILGLVLFNEDLPRMYFRDVRDANQFKNEFPVKDQSQLSVVIEHEKETTEKA